MTDETHWWVILGDVLDVNNVARELMTEGVPARRIIKPGEATLGRRLTMARTIICPSWPQIYAREKYAEWTHWELLTRYGPAETGLAAYDIAGMGAAPPWRPKVTATDSPPQPPPH